MRSWKRYRVGEFAVATVDRTVACNGVSRSIAPKEFDLLVLLIENAGCVVEKDEILRRLWPDSHVTEANLTQYIYRLRGLLGADAIRTVARRGYLLNATVSEEVEAVVPEAAPEAPDRHRHSSLRWWSIVAAAIVALGVFAALWRGRTGTPTPEAYDLYLRGKARLEASHRQRIGTARIEELAAAAQLFRRSIAIDPRFADAHAALAQTLCRSAGSTVDSRVVGEAAETARTALTLEPENIAARVALICVAHQSGAHGDALRLAAEIKRAPNSSPEAYFAAGDALLRAGLAERAVRPMQLAVSAAPKNIHYRQNLAYALMFTHRLEECLATLSPILKRAEGGYGYAMNCFLELRRFDEAIAAGLKLVALDMENPFAFRILALSYRAAGREAEARSMFERGIQRLEGVEETQQNYRNRSALGLMNADLGRRGETQHWIQSALDLDPGNSWVLFFAGLAYGVLGDDDRAMGFLEHSVERGFAQKHLFDWLIRPEMGVRTLTATRRYKDLAARLARRVQEMEAAFQD